MRTVYYVLFVLAVIGWWAASIDIDGPLPAESTWRRTAAGWEVSNRWFPNHIDSEPHPHPVVVAALQFLLSTWALLIASPRQTTRSRVSDGTAARG